MLEVAIHQHDRIAAGVAQAGAQRRLVAEVAREGDEADMRIARRQALDLGQRAIGRAVVDEQDLAAPELPRDLGEARRHGIDVPLLVKDRQDDREQKRSMQIHPPPGSSAPMIVSQRVPPVNDAANYRHAAVSGPSLPCTGSVSGTGTLGMLLSALACSALLPRQRSYLPLLG